jgi:crotonobetainyl-CoA:carnitine CoA-transferase CaiB-like acyl-CoA transferase
MMFADFGAEVIRIDPPGGTMWKSPAARVLNRGKRRICLDLKTRDDLEVAQALVLSADVVIENFRPGVMDRLGLGPDWARELNPALVYLSIPGFSSTDPEFKDVQAWEAVIAAASGQFTDMGLNRVLMGINPSFSPVTLASAYAATLGATGVAAALHARETTGLGDWIEAPIAACLMEGLAYNAMYVEDYPQRYKSLRERERDRRIEAGEPMDLSYRECQSFCDPFYRVYRCADGRFFYPVAGSHATHSPRILRLLGIWDEFKDHLGVFDAFLNTEDWPERPEFTLSNYPCPKHWADRLSARMAKAFKTRAALEWEEIFGNNRAPGAAVRTTKEWLQSEHARESGLIVRLKDDDLGDLLGMGPLAWFHGEDPVDGCRIRQEDEDREAIITELADRPANSVEAKIQKDEERKPALAGIKVLDLSNVLAGPQISSTLVRFGADVIVLGPIHSTMDPWNTVIYGLQVNQGKRSVLANIKDPEGREIFDALLRKVDIVTYNGPDRQMAELGLDPEHLHEINPDLILCKLDCYGGTRNGPRSHHPGYDDTTQASTGIMSRFGGPDTPEEHAHMGTIDVLSGIGGAFGAAIALLQRKRGGPHRFVKTSLATAGQLLQCPFMYDHKGRAAFSEPSGRSVMGDGPFYRCYQASDGWLFLAFPETHVEALESITGLENIATLQADIQTERLANVIASKPRSAWQTNMATLGGSAIALGSLQELRVRYAGDFAEEAGVSQTFQFVRHSSHPCCRAVTLVDWSGIRPGTLPIQHGTPAPKYGAHTRPVLTELGYQAKEIERLLEEETVSESWSKDYMPT